MTDKKGKLRKPELFALTERAVPTSAAEDGSAAVGERLEQARIQLGMTQADFAAALGVSSRTYHRYTTGESPLRVTELARIASVGIDLNWLVTGSGAMQTQESALKLQGHAHALPVQERFVIDEPLIVAAVVAIEAWLDERQLELSPETKGRVVALLVEDAMAHREADRAARIRSQAGLMLRLVS